MSDGKSDTSASRKTLVRIYMMEYVGAIIGILVSILFAILWVIAVLVNGDWHLGEDTLSELGGNVPSRWIFNIAVILTAIGGLRFSFAFAAFLSPSKSGRVGSYLLATSSIGLMAIGFFPIDTGQPHTIATAFFFGFAAIASFVLLYPIGKKAGFRSLQFLLTMAVIIVSFASLATTPIAFAEAVAVSGLLAWIFVIGIWIARDVRKRVDALPVK
jgi:hypothetical membrane protein